MKGFACGEKCIVFKAMSNVRRSGVIFCPQWKRLMEVLRFGVQSVSARIINSLLKNRVKECVIITSCEEVCFPTDR